VIASSVKLTIKGTYTSLNNGGAFNIYGVSCIDPNVATNDDGD